MPERDQIADMADREKDRQPAPMAHRPRLEFVLVDTETVLAHESDTDRDGEWVESDTLVEVLR